MSRIVIALGGNALGNSPSEQLKIVKNTAKNIMDIVQMGNEVIITHGNGPQVGMVNLAFENSHNLKGDTPLMMYHLIELISSIIFGYNFRPYKN